MTSTRVRTADPSPEELAKIEDFLLSIEEFTDLKKDQEKAVWSWLFTDNGRHAPTALVAATDAGSIVGHYGYWPLTYLADGHNIRAGIVCKLAIATEFRKKPLFLQLNMQLIKKASESGVSLLLGLVNRPGMLEFHRAFGFRKIIDIPVLAKPLNLPAVASAAMGRRTARALAPFLSCAQMTMKLASRLHRQIDSIEIKRIEEFLPGDDYETILQNQFSVFAGRKAHDLNRRFTRLGARGYQIYRIKKGGKIAGYTVLRTMPMREFRALAIVDLVLDFKDRALVAETFHFVDRIGRDLNVDLIAAISSSSDLQKHLKRSLYFKTPESFQVIVREHPIQLFPETRAIDGVFISWFDSDHV